MANPNLVGANSVRLKAATATASSSGVTMLSCVAGSNMAMKVASLLASNTGASSVTLRAIFTRGASVTTLIAPSLVTAGQTVVLLSKDTPVYLEEGDSIEVYTASQGQSASLVCSYEEIQ